MRTLKNIIGLFQMARILRDGIIGTGCAILGVMATRTIKNERQRRTTAMLTLFMPCGAKLPVIVLFAGVFFGEAAWVGTLMYFLGIVIY